MYRLTYVAVFAILIMTAVAMLPIILILGALYLLALIMAVFL